MRYIMPFLLSGVLLSACHSLDTEAPEGSMAPIAVTQLSSQGNASKGLVEIKITVSNRLPQDLKIIHIVMELRDAQGKRLSNNDETIEILGPIRRGQKIGPLEKVIPIVNEGKVCIKVTRIEAMTLDYVMLSVDGKDASAVVNGGRKNECGGSSS